MLKTTLNSGCVLSLASLAASEADLSAKRRKMLPATFERDKSQYRVSTKRDYKGKMTIFRFGQDIC